MNSAETCEVPEPAGTPQTLPGYPPIPVETPQVALHKVQSPWTGLLGMAVLILGQWALMAGWIQAPDGVADGGWAAFFWDTRHGTLLAAMFFVMALFEWFGVRVYRRHYDFSLARPIDAHARRRILQRWGGVAALLLLAWTLYLVLDFYRLDLALSRQLGFWLGPQPTGGFYRFQAFSVLLLWVTPAALLTAPFYFAFSHRFQKTDPETDPDEEFILAGRVLGRALLTPLAAGAWLLTSVTAPGISRGFKAFLRESPAAIARDARHPDFANLMRWGAVKFFFLPLMTLYFFNYGAGLEADWQWLTRSQASLPDDASRILPYFALFHDSIFMVDVAFTVIGYAFTLKLFDTHVKSAEATLLGWFVALACYPPFNQITDRFIPHGGDHWWQQTMLGIFQGWEEGLNRLLTTTIDWSFWFLGAWGLAILALLSIYLWATVMFGLRFSNLTNRGILSRGPYALIRHPAYISKNLAWWLMVVPFLRNPVHVAALIGWNLLYILRAFTEERHLRQDPHYREYCQKVRWRFIPGVW